MTEIREKCGVIAISNNENSVYHSLIGLHSLQHRGHEAFGVVAFDKNSNSLKEFYASGTVASNLSKVNISGDYAIGHVRYSTSGGLSFVQPICAQLFEGKIALAHNGNLVNTDEIRENLIKDGCIFQSDVDTEVFIHLIARAKGATLLEKIIIALKQIRGAYSLVLLFNKKIFAIRDPNGIRPLVLGKMDNSYVLASETCALDVLNAKFIRDIEPGEILEIDDDKLTSHIFEEKIQKRFCIFEYVYFARSDSTLEGKNVYQVRKNIGKQLAIESNHNTDVVVPVLDSGMVSAIGYSNESKIPLEIGIVKNNYTGRTFIEPTQENRYLKVKLKHNANRDLLKGKVITLIDDSIVRGTTLKQLVKILREADVKAIHVKIASPKMLNPCYYGVDTPNRKNLIAANYSIEEMEKFFDVDSLHFISLDGLHQAVHNNKESSYCDACFSGNYPVKIS